VNFNIHADQNGQPGNFGFTTGTLTGADCKAGCGTNSADFTTGPVTYVIYNWPAGTSQSVTISS
jgi:hypothetical protein